MLCENCQEVVQIVAAQLSFKKLRAFLTSLYIERFGEDADLPAFRKLMQRAELLENKRNLVTHSQWAYGGDENTIMRFKHTAREKHGLKFHAENFTVDDLAMFVKEIKILAGDITDFWISLSGKPFRVPIKK
jgi:hypothetical protein